MALREMSPSLLKSKMEDTLGLTALRARVTGAVPVSRGLKASLGNSRASKPDKPILGHVPKAPATPRGLFPSHSRRVVDDDDLWGTLPKTTSEWTRRQQRAQVEAGRLTTGDAIGDGSELRGRPSQPRAGETDICGMVDELLVDVLSDMLKADRANFTAEVRLELREVFATWR